MGTNGRLRLEEQCGWLVRLRGQQCHLCSGSTAPLQGRAALRGSQGDVGEHGEQTIILSMNL